MKSELFTDALRGIELTEEGKEPQKDTDFVSAEDRVRVLHDPVRLQILQILREGIEDTQTEESFNDTTGVLLTRQQIVRRDILSVIEIVKISKESESYSPITKNQLYHHLPKLIGAGFVIKYGIVTKGKRTTDYYRRTAENFVTFGLHYDPKEFKRAIRKETKEVLPVFKLNLTKAQEKMFLNLIVDLEAMRLKWAGKIEQLVEEDITNRKAVEMFEWFLWVYATGQNEYLDLLGEVRSILFPSN